MTADKTALPASDPEDEFVDALGGERKSSGDSGSNELTNPRINGFRTRSSRAVRR